MTARTGPTQQQPDLRRGREQSLSREDQQKQLRELVARGQNITAMYAARKLYGCTLEEAKQMVDSLRENKVPQ